MGEHMVMPPIDPSRLASAAFDTSWLEDGSSDGTGGEASLILDCGTVASDELIARWNRHVSSQSAADVGRAYYRPQQASSDGAGAGSASGSSSSASSSSSSSNASNAPPDAHLVGCSWRQYVQKHIDASLSAWRTYAATRGASPDDESNTWRATAAASGTTAPAMANDAGMQAILAHVPCRDQLLQQLHSRFKSAQLLAHDTTELDAQAHLFGLLERRQLDDRQNVATPAMQTAPVPGAQAGDLTPVSVPHAGRSNASAASSSSSSSASSSSAAAPAELLFRVCLYSPQYVRREQEFVVLGSNTLDSLRDRLYCKQEAVMITARQRAAAAAGVAGGTDGSSGCSSPDGAPAEPSPHQCASMFYIEGVCYDDRRPGREMVAAPSQPQNASASSSSSSSSSSSAAASCLPRYLSEGVIAWASKAVREGRSSGWGLLTSGDMGATRFADLRPRLGAHYLWLHAGDCEHILVFTDVRLLTDAPGGYDLLDRRYYPRHVFQARIRRRRCQACEVAFATLQSYGDRLADSNPAYFCEHCFRALHTVTAAGGDGQPTLLGGKDAPLTFAYTHE